MNSRGLPVRRSFLQASSDATSYASPPARQAGNSEAVLCCAVPAEDSGDLLELNL